MPRKGRKPVGWPFNFPPPKNLHELEKWRDKLSEEDYAARKSMLARQRTRVRISRIGIMDPDAYEQMRREYDDRDS